MGKKGRFGIPDRWDDYDAFGDVIPGTRFIAFKVPLMPEYFRSDYNGTPFTTDDLLTGLQHKLGIVIDLSAKGVGLYYNPQDLELQGIRYIKLRVEGQKVPNNFVIQQFDSIVKRFEARSPPDHYIGVHCTHGVNRTGYIITRYMVEHNNYTSQEAMKAFETGRGHPMEREKYIEALQEFEKSLQHGGSIGATSKSDHREVSQSNHTRCYNNDPYWQQGEHNGHYPNHREQWSNGNGYSNWRYNNECYYGNNFADNDYRRGSNSYRGRARARDRDYHPYRDPGPYRGSHFPEYSGQNRSRYRWTNKHERTSYHSNNYSIPSKINHTHFT